MNRADALEALSRERPLTEAEVDALYGAIRRQVSPSQSREAKRARYRLCKDTVNERRRDRWANDPAWRDRKRAINAACYQRRKAR